MGRVHSVRWSTKEWGPHRLSDAEKEAIKTALDKGEYWLARLLEREARGRYVHEEVKKQFRRIYRRGEAGVEEPPAMGGRVPEGLPVQGAADWMRFRALA